MSSRGLSDFWAAQHHNLSPLCGLKVVTVLRKSPASKSPTRTSQVGFRRTFPPDHVTLLLCHLKNLLWSLAAPGIRFRPLSMALCHSLPQKNVPSHSSLGPFDNTGALPPPCSESQGPLRWKGLPQRFSVSQASRPLSDSMGKQGGGGLACLWVLSPSLMQSC